MKCVKCGEFINEGERFCGNCGTPVSEKPTSAEHNREPAKQERKAAIKQEQTEPTKQALTEAVEQKRTESAQQVRMDSVKTNRIETADKKKSHIVPIIIIIVVSVMAIGAASGFLAYRHIKGVIFGGGIERKAAVTASDAKESAKPSETPTASFTSEKTAQPTESPEPKVTAEAQLPDSKGYYTYTNSTYGFSGKYPSWFRVEENSDQTFRCVSNDGRGSIEIFSAAANGRTTKEVMSEFINSSGGEVDYSSSADHYFAVRLKQPNQYSYRYGRLKGGRLYMFAARFPLSDFEEYDRIINDIYNEFVKQF